MDIKEVLPLWFINFFDKKTKGSGVTFANKSIHPNEQLAEKLHKPIIRKLKRRKVYSAFNIKTIFGLQI